MNIFRHLPLLIQLSFGAVAVLLICAIFAQILTPHDITQVDLRNRFQSPAFLGGDWGNPLGTDSLGRDMLSLLLRGIQVSMTIAALGTIGGAVLGVTLGFAGAWIGGWVDDLIGVLIDFQATIPNLILALALLAAFPEVNFMVFVLIMVIYGWEQYARLARAIALSAKNQPYVQAQIIFGASPARIIIRSILPNAAAVLLVNMSINFPRTIMVESTLSFLGIGIQPPDTSLGVLIGQGRDQLYNAPWVALLPGLVILIATISISLLGDWARDLVDKE
ncbi:ABC transporter permease [Pacificibacter marinus]|uniref:ABC transporter permease n=1 Tax=Pacificibacter marinus TaxID=658057 RepID=UPI001C079A6C|nr:ABC transporter permease [Pacificibacter marinus]MBU2865745.1 ABC transporter permease [Pacificibacter marinus]